MNALSQAAAVSSQPALQAGSKVGSDRFMLIRELGRGGMGVVWLAQDTHLGEQVAIKFLPPEVATDPVALDDLRRETVHTHRLTHPNIIRIHDFHQQSDGVAFISMEYVEGMTLSGWRLEQPQQVFTWEQLAPLARQLCAALDYAHGAGVIHRDLKPANVMLDRRGRVKLGDFGIAAMVSDSVSRVSAPSRTGGTLAYMGPQQISGEAPTAADDIYALGATLYELLSGRPPFYRGDLTHQVLNAAVQPLAERMMESGITNPVPRDVAALIMACLAKDRARRPQTAQATAEWISAARVGEAPLASLEEMGTSRPSSWPLGGQREASAASLGEVAAGGPASPEQPFLAEPDADTAESSTSAILPPSPSKPTVLTAVYLVLLFLISGLIACQSWIIAALIHDGIPVGDGDWFYLVGRILLLALFSKILFWILARHIARKR